MKRSLFVLNIIQIVILFTIITIMQSLLLLLLYYYASNCEANLIGLKAKNNWI